MTKYEIEHRAPNRKSGRMASNRVTFDADTDKEALKAFKRAAAYDKRGSIVLRRLGNNVTVRIKEKTFKE